MQWILLRYPEPGAAGGKLKNNAWQFRTNVRIIRTQISNTDVNSVITVCQQKYPLTRTGLKVKSYAIMPRSMIFYTLLYKE